MNTIDYLEERGFQICEDTIYLKGHDDAIIGVSSDFAIVYDYERVVKICYDNFSDKESFTLDDARDFVDFYIIGTRSCGIDPVFVTKI